MSNWCDEFIKDQSEKIRSKVGSKRAIVPISGGVDSAVTLLLAWRALRSKQLLPFTFEDGLRREGEAEWVRKIFTEKVGGIPVEIVNVQPQFFKALAGVEEGDERRVVYSGGIGKETGKVAKDFRATIAFFGTNLLDRKETDAGGQKQHNAWANMGIDTVKEYGFEVVEPLRELYKEQIRELARALGLPPEISERMPFPGPGLAIRMLDPITPERVKLVRRATRIVEDFLLPLKPFQCLACLMKGVATGRREGKGFFGQIISVRCVDSQDSGKTATATFIPPGIEQTIMSHLLAIPTLSRVVIDRTPKPPGRIEYI